jgi:4-amino-4-deoxy-L-arabinose transferase-like glycosyltransferase
MTGWREEQPSLALPLAVAVLAFGLRAVLLGEHAFHMDEALYATFSKRILHGDLLLTGGLNNDKPPLQFYWGALGLGLFGESESGLRLMTALVSAVECGLLAWLLLPLAGTMAAAGAGLLLAASPLHRSFGSTAVMDGLLSLALLGSFGAALKKQPLLAGLAWGLACASKQTAFFLAPVPFLACLAVAEDWRTALKDWSVGAAIVLIPLFLWSALFSHPRLGMILGMAAHQPEVGLRGDGFLARLLLWQRQGQGCLTVPVWWWAAPLVSAGLWWKGQKAWALGALFPVFGLALFAGLNMRLFDRYYVPLIWALAALPALAAALLPRRRFFSALVLALGLFGWFQARNQVFPADQHGAAGSINDGQRDLLAWMDRLEPAGALAASDSGGLRWMGGWYLKGDWALNDGAGREELDALQAEHPGKALYLVSARGREKAVGRRWKLLAESGPWQLWKAEP